MKVREEELEAMSLFIDDLTYAIQDLAAAMSYCARGLDTLKLDRLGHFRETIEKLYERTHETNP